MGGVWFLPNPQVMALLWWAPFPTAIHLQGTIHEQVDLENSSLQNFEEEIVFFNGSQDANPDIASDVFELDSVLWMEPCLPFGNSLFEHQGDPSFQPLITDYVEVFS